jgi:predicted metal-dependent phosphoesterase TrpH
MRIDLHSHSTRSDGRESVAKVFETAAAEGVDILALTDHDTSSGWAEATEVAARLGMGFVPGIEVTTKAHFDEPSGRRRSFSVHMLAYLPNPEHPEFAAALAHSLESRKTRILEMVEVIAPDYPITVDDVLGQLDAGATQGRPAIADALIKKGYFETREDVFAEIWGAHQNGRYYIPNRGTPDTVDAIKLIRAAGGVPVIAHPLARKKSDRSGAESREDGFPRDHFVQMIEAGLAGFEVYHREVDEEARQWLLDLAGEFDLVVTGSSDYHGAGGKPNRLGENTTAPAMLERILEQGRGTSAVL